MKRALIVIVAVLLGVLVSGCWSRKEVNEMAIIAGAGVDRTEAGKWLLTLAIAKPEEIAGEAKKQGTNPAWVTGAEGDTLMEAARTIALQSPRVLFFSHSRVIVIGEEAARTGIGEITDFFSRDRELRLTSFVFVTRGEARGILTRSTRLEELLPTAIADLARSKAGFTIKLKDFLALRAGETTDPAAPLLEPEEKVAPGETGEAQGVKLAGTIFFKDDRSVARLDERATRGLLWLRQELRKGVVVVLCPDDGSKLLTMNITRASRKFKPRIEDGKVSITVEIDAEGDLIEQQCLKDLTKPETIKSIEKRTAQDIRERIFDALQVAKEARVDPYELGEAVRRAFPREFKEIKDRWKDMLPDVEITVDVRFKLRRTGMITQPLGATQKELKKK